MKNIYRCISACVAFLMAVTSVNAQTFEWRLANAVYTDIDPDAAGPAKGIVSFQLQVHTVSGVVANVSGLSTGWCWQSARAMLPTTGPNVPVCAATSILQPSNIVLSGEFVFAGFTYNNVNQCSGNLSVTTGGQAFDRRAVGTIDGGVININTAWKTVFTVSLWTLDHSNPRGGYVFINSGAGGTPAAFSNYSIADVNANEFVVNSATFSSPLPLSSLTLPVTISKFEAHCLSQAALLEWSTASEGNNGYFEVERSSNGADWTMLQRINGTVNTTITRNYSYTDTRGGNYYYRLKQVDMDGSIHYSSIVRTSCTSKEEFVKLYPVPVRDVLTVLIGSDKAKTTTIQIVDARGVVILSRKVNLSTGTNTVQVNMENFAPGMYLLMIEGRHSGEKFILSR